METRSKRVNVSIPPGLWARWEKCLEDHKARTGDPLNLSRIVQEAMEVRIKEVAEMGKGKNP